MRGYVVDVSDNKLVTETYLKVVNECGDVDILINNAGIITSNKTFDLQTEGEILRTMHINTIAPMFVARAILPVKVFDFFFGKVFGIYHAMDQFQGRK